MRVKVDDDEAERRRKPVNSQSESVLSGWTDRDIDKATPSRPRKGAPDAESDSAPRTPGCEGHCVGSGQTGCVSGVPLSYRLTPVHRRVGITPLPGRHTRRPARLAGRGVSVLQLHPGGESLPDPMRGQQPECLVEYVVGVLTADHTHVVA